MVRRIGKGFYIMDPDFQRDFVWDEQRQSRLIESVLMRIPLPVFYLAENLDGKLVVVDGLQRLTTFQRFLENKLRLSLQNAELRGKTFAALPPKLQNRIEDTQITVYIVDAKVPDRARLDIFERVNGGVALSRQQMRNAIYQGKATALLRDLAKDDRRSVQCTIETCEASSRPGSPKKGRSGTTNDFTTSCTSAQRSRSVDRALGDSSVR